ncbi:unnamed protein product [Linum trigynum]|uniref:Uncharacterized protein n=1 Tax=Linum trigynum TaxID=586398 RepID=A0AAV2F9Y2_9ROSI
MESSNRTRIETIPHPIHLHAANVGTRLSPSSYTHEPDLESGQQVLVLGQNSVALGAGPRKWHRGGPPADENLAIVDGAAELGVDGAKAAWVSSLPSDKILHLAAADKQGDDAEGVKIERRRSTDRGIERRKLKWGNCCNR